MDNLYNKRTEHFEILTTTSLHSEGNTAFTTAAFSLSIFFKSNKQQLHKKLPKLRKANFKGGGGECFSLKMGRTCCVPGCHTGYQGRPKDPSISLHRFPKDETRHQQWTRAIPRAN